MDSTIYNLDRNPQLFIDNALIECCYGVRREWYKPTRRVREPLIVRDRPWEQTPYFTYSNY